MKRFIPSLLSVALACASLESMAAADLIITNAKVFTGEPGQALQQAVAVEDGKILQVGSNAAINALADGKTQRIDLAGKVLMPGMIDTHSHPIMGAMASMGANLYDEVKPLAELEQWIIEQDNAGHARHADVILIDGASSAYWEQSAEIGKIFNQGRWADQPVVLNGIDGHTGCANNAMIKRVKIDDMTPEQREAFREATRGLRDWYAKRYGAEWLERLDAAVAAGRQAFEDRRWSGLAPAQRKRQRGKRKQSKAAQIHDLAA